ncbi:MAG: bifunctional diaminohydroxyphosphoribosylaminopyrimidine deaminase/5-amino-6-(5-phosphoribosylamino)uracil reductase RibD [Deltaproteobacteria bacterium]|nr:bifunctional diaminohydroxyphosphoribosylaminopyrimidine deaminase/5-amino-6-(5-phosphoribosylamino)uracil reductase RibD [Deltaproteobacteria bacterium]
MKMALREARKGLGRTSPNPAVGAVVVKNGKFIASGYHKKAGTPHAEIHALQAAGEKARGATLYVTLEPCNHTGRTPPCTQTIMASGISRVVVGMIDPNPLVAGSGCAFLQNKGIAVRTDVLAEQCRAINYPFIKHITTGLPWVIMKAGCSLDGRIAAANDRGGWITCEKSRHEAHRLRNLVDAILIGADTAITDNPSLTTRLKGRKGKDPLRIILDSKLRLSPTARMLGQDSAAPTWIFCSREADMEKAKNLEKAGAKIIRVAKGRNGYLDLPRILKILGDAQVNSLLVEGGGRVHGSFLRAGLVDQVTLFLAPLFLGGDAVPVVDNFRLAGAQEGRRFVPQRIRRFDDDVLIDGLFTSEYGWSDQRLNGKTL